VPEAPGIGVAPPQADFSASGTSGTAPFAVAFSDLSSGNVQARLWNFGDGSFSIEPAPVHTYTTAGSYSVSLTALGFGGQDSLTKAGLIAVNGPGGPDAPTADFSSDRTAGNVPMPVQFTDRSVGEITSWAWNFGDGSTSSAQNPLHTYTSGGRFTVSLAVSGPGGSNAMVKLDHIVANVPGALDVDFVADVTSGSAPLRVRFRAINVSGQALTGTFDFGDGTTGTVGLGNGRIAHVYSNPGVYTVTLTASDAASTDIEQKVGFITVATPLAPSPR
jgi:PKD repeat protein